jgi:hypothetical protein
MKSSKSARQPVVERVSSVIFRLATPRRFAGSEYTRKNTRGKAARRGKFPAIVLILIPGFSRDSEIRAICI